MRDMKYEIYKTNPINEFNTLVYVYVLGLAPIMDFVNTGSSVTSDPSRDKDSII